MSSSSLSAFLKHRMIVNCNLFQTYCATSSSFCSSSFCLLNTCSIISRSSALKCERSGIASAIMALIHPLHREATKQRQSNLKFIGMNPEARKLTLENHRQPRSKNNPKTNPSMNFAVFESKTRSPERMREQDKRQ